MLRTSFAQCTPPFQPAVGLSIASSWSGVVLYEPSTRRQVNILVPQATVHCRCELVHRTRFFLHLTLECAGSQMERTFVDMHRLFGGIEEHVSECPLPLLVLTLCAYAAKNCPLPLCCVHFSLRCEPTMPVVVVKHRGCIQPCVEVGKMCQAGRASSQQPLPPCFPISPRNTRALAVQAAIRGGQK